MQGRGAAPGYNLPVGSNWPTLSDDPITSPYFQDECLWAWPSFKYQTINGAMLHLCLFESTILHYNRLPLGKQIDISMAGSSLLRSIYSSWFLWCSWGSIEKTGGNWSGNHRPHFILISNILISVGMESHHLICIIDFALIQTHDPCLLSALRWLQGHGYKTGRKSRVSP